jgi:hypothetical protein
MANFMRSRAQIPAASSNLVTLSGCTLYTRNFTDSVLNMATADLTKSDLSGTNVPSVGTLLRDMGRSLTLFVEKNDRAVKVAVLREVQKVDGAGTEGVNDKTAYLVPVWVDVTDADGIPSSLDLNLRVRVTRSG